MSKNITMRPDNKGLTVKINLWSMDKFFNEMIDSRQASQCIAGKVTNADTKESVIFNESGKLLTTLGKWNAKKYRELKALHKKGNSN